MYHQPKVYVPRLVVKYLEKGLLSTPEGNGVHKYANSPEYQTS